MVRIAPTRSGKAVHEHEVRRLRPVLDAPLTRLEEQRDELTKTWLLRVVEESSLEEIERLPMARIVRELPELIGDIVRAVGEGHGRRPGLEPEGREYRCASQLTGLRGREAPEPTELVMDIAALESVMIDALGRELPDAESRALLKIVNRLVTSFAAVQAAAVGELVKARSAELESLANTDALTGLYNVRYMHQHLHHLLGLQGRYGHPFALLVLDIDGLKRINDAFGHAVGDRALVGVAAAVRDTIRSIDTPVRMGGDEFCVLAPDQTALRGRVLGERMSSAVSRVAQLEGASVSVSVGVVSCPEHGVEAERLLELADEAMYRAKASGERVAVAVPDASSGRPDNGLSGSRER